jgi:transcriptional regulator with XRE-family HTH domain
VQWRRNDVNVTSEFMKRDRLQQVAKQVREHRVQKNYTQQELADLAGISLRSVQRIERAEVLPRDFTLKTLARHLDLELEPDLAGVPEKQKRLNFQQKLITSIGLALVIIALAFAFVFQSPKFPETAFELCIYIAGLAAVYTLLLARIWRAE